MCIKPQPYVCSCASCGWSKTIAPKSDALKPSEFYVFCPICKNEFLDKRSLSFSEKLFNDLINAMKRYSKVE